MDYQSTINLAAGVAIAVVGLLARVLWGAVKELRRDISNMQANLPKEYVLKVDLDKRMSHIEDMFQRIYDKLDGKADKS